VWDSSWKGADDIACRASQVMGRCWCFIKVYGKPLNRLNQRQEKNLLYVLEAIILWMDQITGVRWMAMKQVVVCA
jgi:hypothetical protein